MFFFFSFFFWYIEQQQILLREKQQVDFPQSNFKIKKLKFLDIHV